MSTRRVIANTASHPLNCYVVNQVESLKRKRLAQAAKDKLKAGPQQFLDFCGDEAAVARQTGGEFTGIVEFSSSSADEQQQISAEIQASLVGIAKTEAEVNSALQKLSSMSRMRVQMIRQGGVESLPDINSLRQYALDFSKTVAAGTGKPWTIALITNDYNTVEGFNGPSSLALQEQAGFLETLAQLRDQGLQIRANLVYARAHPDEFVGVSAASLNDHMADTETKINTIVAAANACQIDPLNQCKSVPKLEFKAFTVVRNKPVYQDQWVRVDELGRAYAQDFNSNDASSRHYEFCDGRRSICGRGEHALTPVGTPYRIYSVEYRCSGDTCGWVYNPDGGYGAKYELLNDARGFQLVEQRGDEPTRPREL